MHQTIKASSCLYNTLPLHLILFIANLLYSLLLPRYQVQLCCDCLWKARDCHNIVQGRRVLHTAVRAYRPTTQRVQERNEYKCLRLDRKAHWCRIAKRPLTHWHFQEALSSPHKHAKFSPWHRASMRLGSALTLIEEAEQSRLKPDVLSFLATWP